MARGILTIRPDMPIIICTGYSSVLSEESSRAIGIAKYLKKPAQKEEIARAVRLVLDQGEILEGR